MGRVIFLVLLVAAPLPLMAQTAPNAELNMAFQAWTECVQSSAQKRYPEIPASTAVLTAFDDCTAEENHLKSLVPSQGFPIKGREGQAAGSMDGDGFVQMMRMELANMLVFALQHPGQNLLPNQPKAP